MHYWGLEAIAKRLDVKPGSILRMYEHEQLPLLKRRRGAHPRLWWYTSDQLLNIWQVVIIKLQRKAHLEKKQSMSREAQERR
jgi:hypothetical protein